MELLNTKTVAILLSSVAILSLSGCKDDGKSGAGSDRTILTEKMPPVAVAEVTPVTAVCPSANPVKVIYNGSKSYDPDGEIINYNWFVNIGGSDVPLSTAVKGEIADVCKIVGDKRGSYEIGLTVEDNDGNRVTDLKNVEIVDNMPPSAVAGADRSINLGDSVTLDAKDSSDPDGQIVKYEWKLGSDIKNTVTVTYDNLPVGVHVVTLTVTDDVGKTGTDTVEVTVIDTANSAPTAKISKPIDGDIIDCYDEGSIEAVRIADSNIKLEGHESSDPDGDTLSFAWSGTAKGAQFKTLIDNKDIEDTFISKDSLCDFVDTWDEETEINNCEQVERKGCKVIFNLNVDDTQASDNDQVVIYLRFPT